MEYIYDSYDVAVVGAGHAGCEAALASARLGLKTILFTISSDAIANMPCNPSIGGTAKGHLVREIDALGGEMAKAADKTLIQSRMLNRGKGPAVHSLRAQIDRPLYMRTMKHTLEQTENLNIKQAEVIDVRLDEEGKVCSVVTKLGAVFPVKAAILATGTYLKGLIHIGDVSYESGPDEVHPAVLLSENLKKIGVTLRRFKTGTPARVSKSSIDFSKLELQPGDDPVIPFSFQTTEPLENKVCCHIAYTNLETHRIIKENLHRSPLYSGQIEGVGPRYCPSIEVKIVRFADKERHQIFVEPMGLETEEMYLNGMSSSLPEDVQLKFLHSVEGFENMKVMRTAYAIEYDCCDSLELLPTLEFKAVKGLYGAGQFNGSSGYEEAAAQGLVAGINASLAVLGKPPMILDRASSYIGTLIDDLVTKGVSDPYRMMTSRSEYRLILRQDNADTRLTEIGYQAGLVGKQQYEAFVEKQKQKVAELKRLEHTVIAPSQQLNDLLVEKGTAPLITGMKLADLIRRPQLSYHDLGPFDNQRSLLSDAVCEQVEVELKYEGYIKRQLIQIGEMRRLEQKLLPVDADYSQLRGIRLEAREKLQKIKPLNIGQASRISGVNPADISVLLIWLESQK